ncbi:MULTISPECIES: TonB-dependent receptor [unclassified Nostoc]|uniref:TonB-dependent receptor n=1 Tax=unclassified Nostoc TaxID=2593658 RepID=UPI0013D33D95|nr:MULTISPECIES: TonB-dependent receptor [unclassified Nostoc]MBE9001844.1 TonB-dependent siderophore receptor [Nostoc sp. LEGE 12447]NEU77744.1 TonB-dependent siderophore receptor [Nostoc sp. UIC 10630]
MKPVLLLKSLLLTGSFALLLATSAWGEEVQLPKKQQETTSNDQEAISKQTANQPYSLAKRALKHRTKSTQKLVQASVVVQVTGVRLNSVDKQLEIILETAQGEQLQPLSKSEGNNFIADIPNAQLRLSTGEVFSQENPFTGITAVTVSNLDANTIRVTVTGKASAPKVELFDDNEGLIFGVIPTISTSQIPPAEQPTSETPQTQPTPSTEQPTTETPSEPPTAETPENEEPIELVVTGEQDRYRVPEASGATRTDTPIRDIPQSIQVIPRQVLKDQQITRLTDAIRNVSGIVEGDSFAGTVDNFNIRGFDFNSTFRDGFREPGDTLRELANIEQIEVLKGPASVLYGNAEPGGIINLVTKRPLSTPYYSADFSAGNFSYYRPSIDISGPLNPDKSLLYRLNVAYENGSSFRDFVDSERSFFGPIFDLKLSDKTNLLVNVDYLKDERTFDQGLVAFGRGIADIPTSRFLGEPGDRREVEEVNVGYRLEHRFNENLTLRNAFRYTSNDSFDYRAQPLDLDEGTGELSRNFRSNDDYTERYSLQTDLVSKFTTGSIQHTLLVGLDLARQKSDGSQRRLPGGLTPSINIFDPVYNLISRPGLSELTNVVRDGNSKTETLGIYLQDQIAFSDNFKLLIGGRFDTVDQNQFNRLSETRTIQYDEAFTPRIGIVYQPIQPISLYASYSRSFAPNFAQSADNTFLEPERGTQYEVGVKVDLNDKLSATLAAYEITKTNIGTANPNDPDGFSLPIGEQRSRGIELDVAGEILPGWNIIAAYGYTDAIVTESNDFRVGSRVAKVPEHKASLWTTYQFLQGNLTGLGFGLGLYYLSDRVGGDLPTLDSDDTFTLPSYLRTDAAIYYKRDNWRAAINIENLFGTRYFESFNFGRNTVIPGAPFTVIGTISFEF